MFYAIIFILFFKIEILHKSNEISISNTPQRIYCFTLRKIILTHLFFQMSKFSVDAIKMVSRDIRLTKPIVNDKQSLIIIRSVIHNKK